MQGLFRVTANDVVVTSTKSMTGHLLGGAGAAHGIGGGQELPGRGLGQLAQPGGLVHRIADDGVLEAGLRADVAGDRPAGRYSDAEVGLAEHLQNGEVGEAYPDRLVVIPGANPFTCTRSGDLPDGLAFDEETLFELNKVMKVPAGITWQEAEIFATL